MTLGMESLRDEGTVSNWTKNKVFSIFRQIFVLREASCDQKSVKGVVYRVKDKLRKSPYKLKKMEHVCFSPIFPHFPPKIGGPYPFKSYFFQIGPLKVISCHKVQF